jgi:hypothetical protein
MPTDIEKIYEEIINASKGHVHLNQLLAKITVLAGLVYDGSPDKDTEQAIAALSRQLIRFQVIDELQSFVIHSKNHHGKQYDELIKSAIDAAQASNKDYQTNISKVLGWAVAKAKASGELRLTKYITVDEARR